VHQYWQCTVSQAKGGGKLTWMKTPRGDINGFLDFSTVIWMTPISKGRTADAAGNAMHEAARNSANDNAMIR